MHPLSDRTASGTPTPSLGSLIGAACIALLDMLLAWQDRAAMRNALQNMTERELRDIGLDRGALADETSKPFWHE